MPIFKSKVATLRSAVPETMNRGQHFFAVVIGGPFQAWIVDIRGQRTDSLKTIREERSGSKGSTELLAVEPIGRALGHTLDIAVVVFAAGKVKVADQLGGVER